MRKYKRQPQKVIDALKMDRKAGMSMSQLMKKYDMSKTGIWHHVQKVELSLEQRKEIRSYIGGSKAEKAREWERAKRQSNEILARVDIRHTWPVLYAALYWSEGTKSSFVFTNTDARMIQVFLYMARNYLDIKNEDLDFMIRTCSPMNINECRKHWASIADVPISQIRINHHDKHNKSTTQFGMCRITLKRGAYHLKLVHCLFRDIADKMLDNRSRSSMDRTNRS